MSDRYDSAILEAVDEAFMILGESGQQIIYHSLEANHQLKREEIPVRLRDFLETLDDLFGEAAKLLGKLITKGFYRRLDLTFEEHENWTLVDYVNDVKKARVGGGV